MPVKSNQFTDEQIFARINRMAIILNSFRLDNEYSVQTEPPIPVETEPLHMRDMTWLKK